MPSTTKHVRARGFLSSIGVEFSMLFMLAGLALAVFTMLSLIGGDAPTIDAKSVVTERVRPEPELDFAPVSNSVPPSSDRTATVIETPQ